MPTLIKALKSKDLNVVLHAARTIELLGPDARAAVPEMKKVVVRADKIRPPDTPPTVVQSGEQDLAMFVSFAAKGFLSRVDGK